MGTAKDVVTPQGHGDTRRTQPPGSCPRPPDPCQGSPREGRGEPLGLFPHPRSQDPLGWPRALLQEGPSSGESHQEPPEGEVLRPLSASGPQEGGKGLLAPLWGVSREGKCTKAAPAPRTDPHSLHAAPEAQPSTGGGTKCMDGAWATQRGGA